MATVPAPRSDVYLSLLAAKALTALADLAKNPTVWNDSIQAGLESGIEYCDALRSAVFPIDRNGSQAEGHGFKRRANDLGRNHRTSAAVAQSEQVKELLNRFLSKARRPLMAEIDLAIDFFSSDEC